jgi:hypothetical protein
MRPYFLIAVLLLGAAPAFAQPYPVQTTYPQQEANVVAYPQVPTTYPQVYTPPQHAVQQPAQIYYDVRPTDAGQSVITDIRQMNF